MPNYSKIAELLAKLPKGTQAARELEAAYQAAKAAEQAAAYAPHTLPTEVGSKAIKKAKSTLAPKEEKAMEAPSIIVPGKVSNVQQKIRESKGEYGAKRVQRAADEIKNLEDQYTEEALRDAFGGDNAKALMIANPAAFKNFASEMHSPYRPALEEYLQKMSPGGGGASDVPFLMLNKNEGRLPFVSGHEGRHRNLAMEELGYPSTLWRMLPRAALREQFPRRSQEEYLEALIKHLGAEEPLVVPEGQSWGAASNLPKLFAKGGLAHMADGGKTRAGTQAQPFPWEEALQAQLERTKTRFKGLAEDPINELRNITRQYLHDPTATPEENEQKQNEFMMGMLSTTPTPTAALKKASEVFGKHEGKYLMITEADRTKIGGGFLGGPGFSGLQHEFPAYKDARAAWGVASPSKAATIAGANARVPEGQAIWAPMLGSPTQHKSNQLVFDQILNKFRRAAKAGELDSELHQKINNALANVVDKNTGNPIFPPDVDIMAKNFRSLANTFDRRAAAADIMGGIGVGGKKGTIIDYPEIIRSTTDPFVMESPVGAVGPRAFTLTGEIGEHPELNPAFPYILRGEDLGELYIPVPRDLAMSDVVRERSAAGKKPTVWAFTRGHGPMQFISEDWLTNLQKHNYAQGGLATGGVPEKRDVSQLFPINPKLQGEPVTRTRAGVPVQDTNVLGGALEGLGETLLGAGRGYASTALGGVQDLLNLVDIPKIMTGESYQIPYGSEYFKENLPLKPTTQTGEAAQELGQFIPVDPTQVAKSGFKAAKTAGKAIAPTAAEMALDLAEKAGTPVRQFAVPPSEGKVGKAKVPANEVGFYNPAEKAALNLQRKKGTGDSFIADLKKQPGVNDERITELGLDQYRGQPNVTNADIYGTARENRIPLRETVRREHDEAAIEELESRHDEILRRMDEAQAEGDRRTYAELDDELRANIQEQKSLKSDGEAKFGPSSHPNYNMPGGENYREIRVGLPARKLSYQDQKMPSLELFERDMMEKYGGNTISSVYNKLTPSEIDKYEMLVNENRNNNKTSRILEDKVSNFYHNAHHGDEPNVLFHLRVADHVDADGKKGLLIDELQSDWHQQGREKGYGRKLSDMPQMSADELYDKHFNDLSPAQKEYLEGFMKKWESADYSGKQEDLDKLTNQYQGWVNKQTIGSGVPNAPFKDNWYQLGLKRAIKEAANTGMDRVYLTTGARQADRYDLSKQVNEVIYSEDGVLTAVGKDGEHIINQKVPKDKLADYIGKEAASKLEKSEPNVVGSKVLSGVDLKVGGEGMRQYYDKNYRNYLEKYAKQFGGKVGETKLYIGQDENTWPAFRDWFAAKYPPGSARGGSGTALYQWEEGTNNKFVREFLNGLEKKYEPVYYIDITPEMRKSAKMGQSYAEGGAVQMAEGGNAWQNILNSAYNSNPDMKDGGEFIQAPAFADGGGVWKQLVKGANNA